MHEAELNKLQSQLKKARDGSAPAINIGKEAQQKNQQTIELGRAEEGHDRFEDQLQTRQAEVQPD